MNVLREFDKLGESPEHAERIAGAEVEAARNESLSRVPRLLEELVVPVTV